MSIIAAYMVPHPPMIIPQIGRGNEKQIQETIDAYRNVAREIASLKPETIIISSPHSVMYSDYFHISPGKNANGDFSNFHARFSGFLLLAAVNSILPLFSALFVPLGVPVDLRDKKVKYHADKRVKLRDSSVFRIIDNGAEEPPALCIVKPVQSGPYGIKVQHNARTILFPLRHQPTAFAC